MTENYGYVRVSTRDQNEDRQLIALEPYHIPPQNIYIDKQSGKNFDRPAYRRLLKRLHEGDLLIVKSIDRLGRNYEEILAQWRFITKKLGAQIYIIDMPLLDTRAEGKNLTGIFIADLVLQILAYVAETERDNIRARQAEGIRAAKLRGVHCGRPQKKADHKTRDMIRRWKRKEITAREAARRLCISIRMFYYIAKNKGR